MAKELETRHCEQCGKAYKVHRFWQKYCTPKCKRAFEIAERDKAYALLRKKNS